MKNFLLVGLLGLCLVISACAKKQTVSPDEELDQNNAEVTDINAALMEPEQFSQEPSIRGAEAKTSTALSVIYFSFDSSSLSSDVLNTIKENVKYLKKNPKINVVIEGHCDERGTTEYNLALGQKRAIKVKEYYVQFGINPNRIATVSYGEEMPADKRHNEAGWEKNRRAETKIIE